LISDRHNRSQDRRREILDLQAASFRLDPKLMDQGRRYGDGAAPARAVLRDLALDRLALMVHDLDPRTPSPRA